MIYTFFIYELIKEERKMKNEKQSHKIIKKIIYA